MTNPAMTIEMAVARISNATYESYQDGSPAKIQAIKAFREVTTIGLKEAKDEIDLCWFEVHNPIAYRAKVRAALRKYGFGAPGLTVTSGIEIRNPITGGMLAQAVLREGTLTIASGDGFDTVVFDASILHDLAVGLAKMAGIPLGGSAVG